MISFINITLSFVYESLNVGPLKDTKISLQLTDSSIVYLDEVLENILIKVNDLMFPANFYVVYREEDDSLDASDILLR